MISDLDRGALHSATWVPVIAQYLTAAGHDIDAALKLSGFPEGLPRAEDAKVPYKNIATFFEHAAELCNDDLLGFRIAQHVDAREAGLIAYVGMNAPTLRGFMRNIAAYARVFSDAIEWDLNNFETKGQVSWSFSAPPSLKRRQSVEWSSALFVSTLRKLTEAPIRCDGVSFVHPRNAHIDEMERFFGCPIAFGSSANMIRFRMSDLACPIVNADPKLLDLLKKVADEALKKTQSNSPELQELVERAILARLSAGEARADVIASDLGMSGRTLARRLGEIEMPFSAILGNLREALATRYIMDSDLSITQIAYLLGYTDSSAFSTAYRHWTGKTPRAARQQQSN
jgi:AraC-like DNA-binding protein